PSAGPRHRHRCWGGDARGARRTALMDIDHDILEEQIAYYRARAAEYDDTVPSGDPFAASAGGTRRALRAFAPRGRVLELAAVTGQWSGLLAEFADGRPCPIRELWRHSG